MSTPAFRLAPLPRRPRAEGVVALINIVFLLLVFFLLTATIAPPEPLPVDLPAADLARAAGDPAEPLHVGADGALAWGAARGEAVFAALASAPAAELALRADAGLDGAAFAALLARLRGLGVETVTLAVVQP
jgi:biopolymer transport protein ExbD